MTSWRPEFRRCKRHGCNRAAADNADYCSLCSVVVLREVLAAIREAKSLKKLKEKLKEVVG